ncbi:MAG: tail fiber domain-containing protein, partial [Actinobacteria bacterium]|nr:tail fiber domain-containing protein [Actinomycetota bacterium]
VASYIDAEVDTQSLTVHNNVTLGDGHPGDDDTVIVNADMVINDNTSSGGVATIEVHSESGLIETVAEMSPLSGATNIATPTSLVTKKYVDDHREEQITASYEVHGIRQGHTNGFNADLVDGLHASTAAQAGIIPAINLDGELQLRKQINLHRQENGDATSFIETASRTQVNLFGTSDSVFLLGLGSGNNRRYIGNNSGTLEILENNITGEAYGTIKAAQYKTASSRSLKTEIEDFNSALSLIQNVHVVSFKYIDQTEPQVGFIAEDTDPLLSGAKQDAMNIPTTVGVLIRAVQELTQQNEALQEQVTTLQQHNVEQLYRLENLEHRVSQGYW